MGITTDKIMHLTAKSLGMVIIDNNGSHTYTLKMKRFPENPPFTIFVDEKDECKIHCNIDIVLQVQERFNQVASDLVKEYYG